MEYKKLENIIYTALNSYETHVNSDYCTFKGPEGKKSFPTEYVGIALGLPRREINELSLAERILNLKSLTKD